MVTPTALLTENTKTFLADKSDQLSPVFIFPSLPRLPLLTTSSLEPFGLVSMTSFCFLSGTAPYISVSPSYGLNLFQVDSFFHCSID